MSPSLTIGILTFNSAATLDRCLKSCQGFHLLISDGGSTDDTLKISRNYHCQIIHQTSSGPIKDFALERNRLLDHTPTDWFFYLDSDEALSPKLAQQLTEISQAKLPPHFAYQVGFQVIYQNKAIDYYSGYPAWQTRFFHKKIHPRFIKPVHERIVWDHQTFPQSQLSGKFYLFWDTNYLRSFWTHARRDADIEIIKAKSQTWLDYPTKIIFHNLKLTTGRTFRVIKNRLLHSHASHLPLSYELDRILYHFYLIYRLTLARLKSSPNS